MNRRATAVVAGVLVVAGVPFLGDFWTFVAALAVIYALLGVSLVVLTGWSGQLNLHVAALGLGWGAYAGFALTRAGVSSVLAIALTGAVTVPFSLVVASIAVRFRGLELAVATLAIGLTFERLAFRNIGRALARASDAATPFQSSFVPVSRPRIGGLEFVRDTPFYFLCLAVAVLVVIVVRNLGRGGTGRTLRAIRSREVVAEILGVPTQRYRVGAFCLSIAIAATAGALFAAHKQGIAPDSFSLDLSFPLLAAVVIGGVRSLEGGIIGGAIAAFLPEMVKIEFPGTDWRPLGFIAGERLFLVFAAAMVLVLLFRPQGIAGLRRRGAGATDDTIPAGTIPPGAPPSAATAVTRRGYATEIERQRGPRVLRAHGLHVSFGGVKALDGADVWLGSSEICALIGPNGAGKSTLFNCLSGLVRPDEGRVYLSGDDVTEAPPHRRAQLGMGRTFQSVEVFSELTVLENMMVAGHVRRAAGSLADALRLGAAAQSERLLGAHAREVLGSLGMERQAGLRPGALSFGHLRLLEIGMALMAEPKVLLLDEPSAGLNPSDSEALAHYVAQLREERDLSVLLVEHDMAVVGAIADWVYVLDFGKVIASATPSRIRRDPLVIARYLGKPVEEVTHAASA